MFNKEEIDEIEEYLLNSPTNSKIYLGSDSVKYKKNGYWYARYIVVLVIHIGSKNGAKVFSYTEIEKVFDPIKKPRLRLMQEVYKVSECYIKLSKILDSFDIEVHLDLNSNPEHFSNKVVKEACGYIRGVIGIEAKIKPEAFIASHCADHATHHGDFHKKSNTQRH